MKHFGKNAVEAAVEDAVEAAGASVRRIPAFAVPALALILILVLTCSACAENKGGGETTALTETEPPVIVPRDDANTATLGDGEVNSRFVLLADIVNGRVIVSKNADEKMYPASLTKIFTILVCCDYIEDFDAKAAVRNDVVQKAFAQGASMAGFTPGESVTMRDLLYGAALPSGADATGTLAVYIAGGEEEFAKLMNRKAAELGLKSTRFANSSGLHDDKHFTTPREMAAILAYASKNEMCMKILSAESYVTSKTEEHPKGITLYNSGLGSMKVKKFGDTVVKAAKTGYTDEAKCCFATFAESKNGKYALVTGYASDKQARMKDSEYIYGKYAK